MTTPGSSSDSSVASSRASPRASSRPPRHLHGGWRRFGALPPSSFASIWAPASPLGDFRRTGSHRATRLAPRASRNGGPTRSSRTGPHSISRCLARHCSRRSTCPRLHPVGRGPVGPHRCARLSHGPCIVLRAPSLRGSLGAGGASWDQRLRPGHVPAPPTCLASGPVLAAVIVAGPTGRIGADRPWRSSPRACDLSWPSPAGATTERVFRVQPPPKARVRGYQLGVGRRDRHRSPRCSPKGAA